MSADNFQTSRMLLRDCPFEEQLEAFAELQGWRRIAVSKATSGRREGAWAVNDTATLQYVRDEMSPNCYVYVEGSDLEAVSAAATLVYEVLEPQVQSDILPEVDAAPGPLRLGQALIRLGIVAPAERDSEVLTRILAGLSHPDARVRNMALWATTYSPWAEYRPRIAAMADADPEGELRERARMTLEAFDASGVSES